MVARPRAQHVRTDVDGADGLDRRDVCDRREPEVLLELGLVKADAALEPVPVASAYASLNPALMRGAEDVRVVGLDVAVAIPEHADLDGEVLDVEEVVRGVPRPARCRADRRLGPARSRSTATRTSRTRPCSRLCSPRNAAPTSRARRGACTRSLRGSSRCRRGTARACLASSTASRVAVELELDARSSTPGAVSAGGSPRGERIGRRRVVEDRGLGLRGGRSAVGRRPSSPRGGRRSRRGLGFRTTVRGRRRGVPAAAKATSSANVGDEDSVRRARLHGTRELALARQQLVGRQETGSTSSGLTVVGVITSTRTAATGTVCRRCSSSRR